jgi:hypothetical protein
LTRDEIAAEMGVSVCTIQTHATPPAAFNALYWSAEEGVKVQ